LIEVLVAVVVLSLGVLAMAGLQLSGLRTSQGAHYRAQAATLTSDMVERLRSNLPNANTYAFSFGATVPTGSALRDVDIRDWMTRVRTLPAGRGQIVVDTTNERATVSVEWDDRRAGGAQQQVYTVSVRLWNQDLP
jgi:type IV pilus assembly protein PilV